MKISIYKNKSETLGSSRYSSNKEKKMTDTCIKLFTDGGCSGNGTADARAGFGVVGYIDNVKYLEIYGRVSRYFVKGYDINTISSGKLLHTRTEFSPTNNRGELTGILFCLLELDAISTKDMKNISVIIHSDSNISVNTVNEWLPNRKASGTTNQLKNIDLLIVIDTLLENLKMKFSNIQLIYIPRKQNTEADALATIGKNNNEYLYTPLVVHPLLFP
jgi:ribonuclease HI